MKNNFLLPLLLLGVVVPALNGQTCLPSSSAADLATPTLQARIRGNGLLFAGSSSPQFIPNPVSGSDNPGTIYTAGLWLGGIDPDGNLRLAAPNFTSATVPTGLYPGPLDENGLVDAANCALWDQQFAVSGAEIADFLSALPALTPAQAVVAFPAVLGWPAVGNPYFTDLHGFTLPNTPAGLAPFADVNSDGAYNPMHGDYPAVRLAGHAPFVPAEIIWNVFNDAGDVPAASAFQYEIQLTAWVFDCPGAAALNRTVFTAHKMIYRGTETLDAVYVGLWADFDIGCPQDDYVGSLPAQNAFFAYNADAVDNPACSGVAAFSSAAPVQSVTLLNRPLDHFVYTASASSGNFPATVTDPVQPLQYYHNLTGRFRDGTPIRAGGFGTQPGAPIVQHAFPGDPADAAAWTPCSSNVPTGDFRGLGSHNAGTVQPGQVLELVTAWAYHPDPALPCGIGSTSADIAAVQSLFDGGFTAACSPLTATHELALAGFAVAPNPATHRVRVEYGNLPAEVLRVFGPDGRLVQQLLDLPAHGVEFSVEALPAGVYFLELGAGRQRGWQKLVVVR